MAARTVVCPECGAEVPSGRLSCAGCGTLLASVAGAARRPAAIDRLVPGGSGDAYAIDAVDAAAASSRTSRNTSARASVDRAERPVRPIPPVLHDWVGPLPDAVISSTAAASAGPAPATSGRKVSPGAASRRRAARPADLVPEAPAETVPVPPEPAVHSMFAAQEADVGPDAEPGVYADLRVDEDAPLRSAIPGAYVAPSTIPAAAPTIVPTVAPTIDGRPATATTIAAAALAEGTVASVAATPRPDRWFSVPGPARDASSTPGKAGIFSDLPFRAPQGVAGWAVAIGALLGAVAYVLPWAEVGVIGTQFDPTFTGRWGLANPANLVSLLVAIVLLLMTLIPSRIPVSIRGVVLPIVIGGWFLGIAWTYATGPFGLGWGVDAVAVGGIVLLVGGAMGMRRSEAAPSAEATTDAPQA